MADVRIRPEAMSRKKQNLLLQPRLPGLEFEPPRHLHTVVTVTSHLIKADRGVQMPLPEKARKRPAATMRPARQPAVGKGPGRLATASVTQQPEGER